MKTSQDRARCKFVCYDRRSNSKLNQIRRLILSGMPPYVTLLMIIGVVFPAEVIASLRR